MPRGESALRVTTPNYPDLILVERLPASAKFDMVGL